MVTIDTTTPQLKVLQKLADTLAALNLYDAGPILSKDFTLKKLPKSPELPDLSKEEYLQQHNVMVAMFPKAEVRIRYLGAAQNPEANTRISRLKVSSSEERSS